MDGPKNPNGIPIGYIGEADVKIEDYLNDPTLGMDTWKDNLGFEDAILDSQAAIDDYNSFIAEIQANNKPRIVNR